MLEYHMYKKHVNLFSKCPWKTNVQSWIKFTQKQPVPTSDSNSNSQISIRDIEIASESNSGYGFTMPFKSKWVSIPNVPVIFSIIYYIFEKAKNW